MNCIKCGGAIKHFPDYLEDADVDVVCQNCSGQKDQPPKLFSMYTGSDISSRNIHIHGYTGATSLCYAS